MAYNKLINIKLTNMKTSKITLFIATFIAMLFFCGQVLAETPIKDVVGGPSVVGKITKISGTQITLDATNKKVYTIDAQKAKIGTSVGQDRENLKVSDLKVGDKIKVEGKITKLDVTAFKIVVIGSKQNIIGIITEVSGETFKMKRAGGDIKSGQEEIYTVSVTKDTPIKNLGKPATIIDLKANIKVVVTGAIDETNRTISASGINITEGEKAEAAKIKAKKEGGIGTKIGNFFKGLMFWKKK